MIHGNTKGLQLLSNQMRPEIVRRFRASASRMQRNSTAPSLFVSLLFFWNAVQLRNQLQVARKSQQTTILKVFVSFCLTICPLSETRHVSVRVPKKRRFSVSSLIASSHWLDAEATPCRLGVIDQLSKRASLTVQRWMIHRGAESCRLRNNDQVSANSCPLENPIHHHLISHGTSKSQGGSRHLLISPCNSRNLRGRGNCESVRRNSTFRAPTVSLSSSSTKFASPHRKRNHRTEMHTDIRQCPLVQIFGSKWALTKENIFENNNNTDSQTRRADLLFWTWTFIAQLKLTKFLRWSEQVNFPATWSMTCFKNSIMTVFLVHKRQNRFKNHNKVIKFLLIAALKLLKSNKMLTESVTRWAGLICFLDSWDFYEWRMRKRHRRKTHAAWNNTDVFSVEEPRGMPYLKHSGAGATLFSPILGQNAPATHTTTLVWSQRWNKLTASLMQILALVHNGWSLNHTATPRQELSCTDENLRPLVVGTGRAVVRKFRKLTLVYLLDPPDSRVEGSCWRETEDKKCKLQPLSLTRGWMKEHNKTTLKETRNLKSGTNGPLFSPVTSSDVIPVLLWQKPRIKRGESVRPGFRHLASVAYVCWKRWTLAPGSDCWRY